MNNHQSWSCLKTLGEGLIIFFAVISLRADMVRTQSIALHKGWNAVFLQVDPATPKPADCFQGTPVTMAAAFTGAEKSLQFSKCGSKLIVRPKF